MAMSHSPGLQQLNIWFVKSILTKQLPICDLASHGARMYQPHRLEHVSVFSHSKLITGFYVAWLQITDRSWSSLELHFILSYFLRIWLLLQKVNLAFTKVNLGAYWGMGQTHNSSANQSAPLLRMPSSAKAGFHWLSLPQFLPLLSEFISDIHLFVRYFKLAVTALSSSFCREEFPRMMQELKQGSQWNILACHHYSFTYSIIHSTNIYRLYILRKARY